MGKACKSRQHGNIQYPSITSLTPYLPSGTKAVYARDFLPTDSTESIPQSS